MRRESPKGALRLKSAQPCAGSLLNIREVLPPNLAIKVGVRRAGIPIKGSLRSVHERALKLVRNLAKVFLNISTLRNADNRTHDPFFLHPLPHNLKAEEKKPWLGSVGENHCIPKLDVGARGDSKISLVRIALCDQRRYR